MPPHTDTHKLKSPPKWGHLHVPVSDNLGGWNRMTYSERAKRNGCLVTFRLGECGFLVCQCMVCEVKVNVIYKWAVTLLLIYWACVPHYSHSRLRNVLCLQSLLTQKLFSKLNDTIKLQMFHRIKWTWRRQYTLINVYHWCCKKGTKGLFVLFDIIYIINNLKVKLKNGWFCFFPSIYINYAHCVSLGYCQRPFVS